MSLQQLAQRITSKPFELAQYLTLNKSIETTVISVYTGCSKRTEWLESLSDLCREKNTLRVKDIVYHRMVNTHVYPLLNATFCPHVNLTDNEFRDYLKELAYRGLSERNITTDTVVEAKETYHLVCVKDYHRIPILHSCEAKRKEMNSFQDMSTSMGLLSLMCTCISLVSLLFVIVTYSILRPLRANTGTSTLSMSCVLFLAQVLYEVGIEQFEVHHLCLVLAVLIHFFWLSAVFMMSSCTLQLFYSVFYPLQARVVLASSKVLKASLTLSFALSIFMIGLVMLGNQLVHGDLGYPHPYLCFIRRPLSRQLGFGLPLGLAVLTNVITFIVTMIRIHREPDLSGSRENTVSLVACFRLSVITGLSWLTLYMLKVPGTRPWLEYVSVVLLGLQGLMLATTLLLNRRVYSLWKEFFHRRREDSRQTSNGRSNSLEPSGKMSTDSCSFDAP